MRSDAAFVQTTAGANGSILYANRTGRVTVWIRRAGKRTIVADVAPGEVSVRYDTGLGIAGFGSAISPAYP